MLFGSVGKKANNNVVDVFLVQSLLNYHAKKSHSGRPMLAVDGDCGTKTVKSIGWFQKTNLGFSRPDYRVDVGGKSWKALIAPPKTAKGGQAGPPPKPDAVDDDEIENQLAGIKEKYHFSQEEMLVLRKMTTNWTKIFGRVRAGTQLANILVVQSEIISKVGLAGRGIAFSAGIMNMLAPFVMWYSFFKAVESSYGLPYLIYSARARAYAATAFAFEDHPAPEKSQHFMDQAPIMNWDVARMNKIWKDAALKTRISMSNSITRVFNENPDLDSQLIRKACLVALRTGANNDPKQFCLQVLKSQEDLFNNHGTRLVMYRGGYGVQYKS